MATADPAATGPLAAAARSGGLGRYVVRRVGSGLATLLVASILIFVGTQVLPGDVASAILGRNATPEARAALEADLGLDRPLPVRYATWLGDAARGDLGRSAAGSVAGTNPSVGGIIGEPLRNSAILAGLAFLLALPLSLVVGVWSAAHAGRRREGVVSAATLALAAVPEFAVAALLVALVAVRLGWLPAVSTFPPGSSALAHPDMLVLPVASLVLVAIPWAARLVRAGVIESLGAPYVRAARLNGFRERVVVWRIALRNALAPAVQVYALTAMYLFGGVVLVEQVFSYPGIGQVLVNAVLQRDVLLVQGVALVLAAAYIAIGIVADVLVVLLVPRLRTGL